MYRTTYELLALKEAISKELAGSDGAGLEVRHGDCPLLLSLTAACSEE